MDIEKKTVKELKVILRERGLKLSGNKKELISRLKEQIGDDENITINELKKNIRKKSPTKTSPHKLKLIVTKYNHNLYKIAGVKATIKNKDKLKQLGAIYRPKLKDGPGWLVKSKIWSEVKPWLESLSTSEYNIVWSIDENIDQKEENNKIIEQISYLEKLPTEIARMLLSKLPTNDIMKLCSVNKYFIGLVCNDFFWKNLISKISPAYFFIELPKGYDSWKLVFLTLQYYLVDFGNKSGTVKSGAQIYLSGKQRCFKTKQYTRRCFIDDTGTVGVITYVDKKDGIINEIKYNNFKQLAYNLKLVARGIRMIDPIEYNQQNKKDVRTLNIQNFGISNLKYPYLIYKNQRPVSFIGQIIFYYPFKGRWYYPDGSTVSENPFYKYQVTGFEKNGNLKVLLIDQKKEAEKYEFDGKRNESVKYKEDILVYDEIDKNHHFLKNKFVESYKISKEYKGGDKVYVNIIYEPIKEKFYTESIGDFA